MKKKNLVTSAVLALSSLALLAACGGGGEPTSGSTPTGSSTAVTYTITQDLPAGVELKGVPEKAAEGDRISFTINVTADGAVVDKVTFNDTVIEPSSTGRYRFDMPAGAVTIKVTLASVSAISLDTTNVRKSYIKNAVFSAEGLVVKATIGGTESEVSTGYTVSSPDMTEVGKKTVTVTYAGKSATFDIFVGDLETDDIDIVVREGHAYFRILGSYSAFENIAGLNEAAKGMFMADFQYNDNIGGRGWSRVFESNQITFLEDGTGRWAVEIDVTEFDGTDSGIGYTLHFGLPQGAGGVVGQESDAGHAGDMKFPEGDHPNDGKVVTVGSKSYTISANAGADTNDPLKFWGCCGLIVKDTDAAGLTVTGVTAVANETSAEIVIAGIYNKVDVSAEAIANDLYVDMQQFSTWSTPVTPVITFTADEGETESGTFEVRFDITDKLDTLGDYFFHFHYEEGAASMSGHGNLAWGEGFVESTVTDPVNGGIISVFRKTDGESWQRGLVTVNYLGGDYAIADSVKLDEEEGKAIFVVGGIYSGITNNDNEDYFLDCMDFETNTDISSEGADATLKLIPENPGDTKGRFEVSLDVTGKLAEGKEYYCHFGPLPEGSSYRTNLRALNLTDPIEVDVASGTYTLKASSGMAEDWQNGLAVLSFAASE